VSPWYFWADVAPHQHDAIYARRTPKVQPSPSVKYRGFFINDEAPALTGYIKNHFPDLEYGPGYNADFYATVFELLLRLRANYLWPAMWASMFNFDDARNQPLADEYGIVMGTSHTEPLACATKEWGNFGNGSWSWRTNQENVAPFFRSCAERAKGYDTLYTMGMRGYDDTALSPNTEIDLLEDIVKAQREILFDINNGSLVPQVWTLYEEVMDYFTQGMTVPDDIILLFADDNWGNIRRLPMANETDRQGGFGVYYHFDLVGDPRCHKWINTIQLERTWQQMHEAYQRNARDLWVVNVGDIKPLEIPISHFFDLAYDINSYGPDSVPVWLDSWARREFGAEFSSEIVEVTHNYTHLAHRRVPEGLDGATLQTASPSVDQPELRSSTQRPETYSILNYNEAENILAEWQTLVNQSQALLARLPKANQPSFFQMVAHPIQAMATVHEVIIAAAQNRMYAEQGRNSANNKAEHVLRMFDFDNDLMEQYNSQLDGKWDGMMDQTHIGYTYWQQPMRQMTPALNYVHARQQAIFGDYGVAVEGSRARVPGDDRFHDLNSVTLPLPPIDPYSPPTYFDIFSTSPNPITWNVTTEPFVLLTHTAGSLTPDSAHDLRVTVNIDWSLAPPGSGSTLLNFSGSGTYGTQTSAPHIELFYNNTMTPENFTGFIEGGSYLAIEAEHYTQIVPGSSNETILLLPGHGRTLSALQLNNSLAPSLTADNAPTLEYTFYKHTVPSTNASAPSHFNVTLSFSTALNNHPGRPHAVAVSFDDLDPRRIEYIGPAPPGRLARPAGWTDAVYNAAWLHTSTWEDHLEVGAHTLKVSLLEPGTVLMRIMVDFGGLRDSYLGPPESVRV
jgi:hypothetical protein